jgi:uncharacterized membrane protein
MTTPRPPMAGGFLIFASLMIGLVVGTNRGEPSLGIVIGAAAGLLLALLLWLWDRRPRNG